jgi:hypothetical protein
MEMVMNVLDTLLAPFSLAANGVINHHSRTWAQKVFFSFLIWNTLNHGSDQFDFNVSFTVA